MFDSHTALLLAGARRRDLAEEYRRAQSLTFGLRSGYRRLAAACSTISTRARSAGSATSRDVNAGRGGPTAVGVCDEQGISRRTTSVVSA